jgi:ABC transporter substrate binding protein
LRELGVIENRHVVLDVVWINSEPEIPQVVNELMQRGAKLLIPCGTSASVAAKQQVSMIPIVFINVGNPVGVGLVESLSRPGGNVTGFSDMHADLSGKYVQFASELASRKSQSIIFGSPDGRTGNTVVLGVQMDQRLPTKLLVLASKQTPQDGADPIDQAGQGVLALVQQAANISKQNADRAMSMAHRLSLELRAAEDRIRQLEADIEHLESRTTRAERWLEMIKNEVEVKLIAPMEANRAKLPALH